MEHKNEVEVISPIEQAARACVAEYNTWWFSYLELDLLVKLLQSRRVGMARDISFENKILWALVHSNENYSKVKADQSTHNELSRLFLIKYNRGDQDLHDFKKGESAKFPGALRGLLMSLAGHLEAHINYPCLRQMELDTTSHMLPFLTTQEQVSLFSTCRALKEKAVLIMPIHKLLYLVSRGRQAEAEEMIRANPESLQQKGDITDGAGRYFKQITALQYAVWALDAPMWVMMLPLFPHAALINGFSVAAADQLRQLEEEGTAHGGHFDFKPLLDGGVRMLMRHRADAAEWRIGRVSRPLSSHERRLEVRERVYHRRGPTWQVEHRLGRSPSSCERNMVVFVLLCYYMAIFLAHTIHYGETPFAAVLSFYIDLVTPASPKGGAERLMFATPTGPV